MATLQDLGINPKNIHWNLNAPQLYEKAIKKNDGSIISDTGALMVYSGNKTGRSPNDKRIVKNDASKNNVNWGKINIEMSANAFQINKQRAIDYFNIKDDIYVVDGFAGWDENYRIKVRIICTRPYHALFMRNMLIVPTKEELQNFGQPQCTIFNAGEFPANLNTEGVSSNTSICMDLENKEMVILGTEYAGEMKKGIFSLFNYLAPLKNILSMHCSANEGDEGDVSLFFGLSGTGKTTLSADKRRKLIGDDEHCWTEQGVFNIEGGCYAKAIGLTQEQEPEIYNAVKFGSVLENVLYNNTTRSVDFNDTSITENTRICYPIDYIENAKIPCKSSHPKNIIFLTCDAYGVLPPISKLTVEQACYYFVSGYTAKVAGTEMGVSEPSATFSACFGAAFMVWHPSKYSELLSAKIKENNVNVWMINTGWTGGGYGVGSRIKLKYTRLMIDAIHQNKFNDIEFENFDGFNLCIPKSCPDVPSEILNPENGWKDKTAFNNTLLKLSQIFNKNMEQYEQFLDDDVRKCGPVLK